MSSTHRHLLLDFFWQVISGPPCIVEKGSYDNMTILSVLRNLKMHTLCGHEYAVVVKIRARYELSYFPESFTGVDLSFGKICKPVVNRNRSCKLLS
jgi:hypothetical protein